MDKKSKQSDDDIFVRIPKVYCNTVKTSHSYYDFQLVFGTAVLNNLSSESMVMVEPQFIAQMSPQHFKAMVSILSGQLTKYEEEFGILPPPADGGDTENTK